MVISIQDIEKSIKNVLGNATVKSANSVYENIDDGYRLVIDIKNLFDEKTNVIYTKFIFNVDKNKIYLLSNKSDNFEFKYLYNINCNYNVYNFNSTEEFERILGSIINDNKFGNDIKILSEFIKSPSSLINKWLSDNDVKNISVFDVKLDDRQKISPCESIFFSFIINLNNQMNIKFSVQKLEKFNYNYKFQIYDDIIFINKPNLSTLIEVIGDTLKSKYI